MKTKLFLLFTFIFILRFPVSSQLLISGAVRNDAAYTYFKDENEQSGNKSRFDDILENKIILRYEEDTWRFYGDGRLYLYYGEIRETTDEYEAKLMRSFIRYSPSIGQFTLGKTYINLGNPGLFNPFEKDKQVIMSDLGYDKEGMLAFEYVLPVGDLSGIKTYAATYESETPAAMPEQERHNAAGMSIWTNALNFDFGAVANRLREDANITGAYIKGDLILGVQGAYAFHYNDEFDKPWREANIGIDYSFFNAHIIISSIFYYNQHGAKKIEEYLPSPDNYLYAKYYLFSKVELIYDEFLSGEIGSFINLIDNSAVIYPSITYLLADGLSITGMVYFFTGENDTEFSRDTSGNISALARVEAKF